MILVDALRKLEVSRLTVEEAVVLADILRTRLTELDARLSVSEFYSYADPSIWQPTAGRKVCFVLTDREMEFLKEIASSLGVAHSILFRTSVMEVHQRFVVRRAATWAPRPRKEKRRRTLGVTLDPSEALRFAELEREVQMLRRRTLANKTSKGSKGHDVIRDLAIDALRDMNRTKWESACRRNEAGEGDS